MPHVRSLLYVYPFCNLGGVASVFKQRLPYLTEAGYAVDGLFSHDYGGRNGLLEAGFRSVKITPDPLNWLMEHVSRYDAIVVVDMPEVVRAVGGSSKAPPLLYEIHSAIERVILANDNESLLACRRVIVPSHWLKSVVRRHFPVLGEQDVVVCANIVDAAMFKPAPAGDGAESGDLIWVGKIDEHKNWQEALHIMRRHFQAETRAQGVIVTGGRLTERLMDGVLEELERLRIAEKVFWLHNVPYAEMPDIYRRIAASRGVLLQCSKAESFGMVVHEAARCGVPAVSRRSGAVAEFVEHEVSGWIYDDGDVDSASRGVSRLTSDGVFRRHTMEGIAAKLRCYAPDVVGREYISALESTLSK
jgi:glycosyltransferase involved in cell wall biosynthesis